MQRFPARTPEWLSTWMGASAALFFALMLSVPSGYSVAGSLLLLGALAVWICTSTVWRQGEAFGLRPAWSREDRMLCGLLALVFVANAAAVAWHGDEGKYLDQGLRYLLGVPILMALRRARLRLAWIWAGLGVGLCGAAAVAWWQTGHIGYLRAFGFLTSAIPFGDMALLMTFWCLMGAILAGMQGRGAAAGGLALCVIAGVYATMASGTRGALLAAPLLLVLAGVALYRGGSGRRFRMAALGVLVIALCAAWLVPSVRHTLAHRYTETMNQWQAYAQRGSTSQGEVMNNIGSRIESWKTALQSIPQRPVLGWGHAEYDEHLRGLVAAGQADPIVAELSNTHNNFIEVWLHQGTLGLAAFLALLCASTWYFLRRLRATDLTVRVLACCGASLPMAFAAFGLTQVILGRNNGVMFFVLSLTIFWAALRQAEAEAQMA